MRLHRNNRKLTKELEEFTRDLYTVEHDARKHLPEYMVVLGLGRQVQIGQSAVTAAIDTTLLL